MKINCYKTELVLLNTILIENFTIKFNPSNDTKNLITARRSVLNIFALLLKFVL